MLAAPESVVYFLVKQGQIVLLRFVFNYRCQYFSIRALAGHTEEQGLIN
jgi:hypothetical protein